MKMTTKQLSKFFLITVLLYCSSAFTNESCEESKWGADDEIGAANYVNTAQILKAIRLVKKGESHPLGIVIAPGMPSYPPRYAQLQVVQPDQQHGFDASTIFGWPISSNDDIVQMWLGTGSQLDGLGHMGESNTFYNCNKGSDFSLITGLTKIGIEKIPPMVGRGVLLDVAKHKGVPYLKAGEPIYSSDISEIAKKQNISFSTGDVILLHTGWTDAKLKTEPDVWGAGEPGITNEAATYLASLNPMAVGSDTWGVEVAPNIEGDKLFYGHVTLLKKNGIFILETMNTGRLAEENVTEFMFVLGQARLKGAVQMIINPVALW